MKVNILGTRYKVLVATLDERPKLKECDGYTDYSIKEIVVGKFEADTMSMDDLQFHTKKVMRHEIIHAFLYESGLRENSVNESAWAESEEMIDWFAIQSPKIFKTFQEVGCL